MRLLLDQNLSPHTTSFLRDLGYDVRDVRELNLLGVGDEALLRVAEKGKRIVITFDTDFANTIEFPLGSHAGVIRLKIVPQTLEILHPISAKRTCLTGGDELGRLPRHN